MTFFLILPVLYLLLIRDVLLLYLNLFYALSSALDLLFLSVESKIKALKMCLFQKSSHFVISILMYSFEIE